MVVEHFYRYLNESGFSPKAGLALATSGGAAEHPHLFSGTIAQAEQFAKALLVVDDVAKTRYYQAGASAKTRDPIVTYNESMLRFEAFSSCNGVYCRLDVDPASFTATHTMLGTTNFDMNDSVREALAAVKSGEPLTLTVGRPHTEAEAKADTVLEQMVPVPDRWLKGFCEVQIAEAMMAPVIELNEAAAKIAVRDLPMQKQGNHPFGVIFSPNGAHLANRPDNAIMTLVGPQRLASLRRVTAYIKSLRVFSSPSGSRRHMSNLGGEVLRSSAWVVTMDGARLTIVVSPELYRGFTGEGTVIETLASADESIAASIAATLKGQAELPSHALAKQLGVTRIAVIDGLRVLGASGRVGFDLDTECFYHRDLPFDRSALEEMQPRLHEAGDLVKAGAVTIGKLNATVIEADGTKYTVKGQDEKQKCNCPLFARHRGDIQCKHILAVKLTVNA
jgi:SWIM zinc finger